MLRLSSRNVIWYQYTRKSGGNQSMTEATQDAKQLVRDYAEMWSEKDIKRIPDLVSESFTGVVPESEEDI